MINLNVHSSYDFLSSNIKISELLDKLNSDGQKAVAITDTHKLHGIYELLTLAPKYNIKPLVGMEVKIDDFNYSLVCIAKDNVGYQSLIKLSAVISYQNVEHVSFELLEKYITHCVLIGTHEVTVDYLKSSSFDIDDCYQTHLIHGDSLKVVYMTPSYYLTRDEKMAVDVLHAIRDNTRLDYQSLGKEPGDEFLRLKDDVKDIDPEILINNQRIVDQCTVELPKVKRTLPKFKTDNEQSSKDLLWDMLIEQLPKKTPNDDKYFNRLKHEYDIICEMEYEDYFLIVQDLINFAKSEGILVGPGRGSSSASLVSYLLNITEIDPLPYGLLFERFLNPKRVSMPDIDIDFEDTRRDEVIRYLNEKYGQASVSYIITFNTLTTKAVVREVGRVFNFTEDMLKRLSSIISVNKSLNVEALLQTKDYKQLRESDPIYDVYSEIILALEDVPRHAGMHAAGILLSSEPLMNTVPVSFIHEDGQGMLISQWPMDQVEATGLLKIDILALRTLSLVKAMVQQIRRKNPDFKLSHIDDNRDDERVYRMLTRGYALGIFQLETQLMRDNLPVVQPRNFNELIAMISLNRPGPIAEIPRYIQGKNNSDDIDYLHRDLEDILQSTYGVITYQEQVMQIASRFANFSFGEADLLRRAMSKKNHQAVEEMRQKFIDGATAVGYDETVSIKLFNMIDQFKDYGFPKSHAVSYAAISYWMAYLKVYYPVVFFSVILNVHSGSNEKIHALLREIKAFRIAVNPPSINQSFFYNTEKDGILLGFQMIKGLNYKASQAIIEERIQNGNYHDLYELKSRIDAKYLNNNTLKSLILSGALDDFNMTRKSMLQTLSKISDVKKDEYSHHGFLTELGFNFKEETAIEEEMPEIEKVEQEKEVLGFYVSPHPVLVLRKKYEYIHFDRFDTERNGVYIAFIDERKSIKTKKGEDMAFLGLTDGHKELEGVVFPSVYLDVFHLLREQYVVIRGKIGRRDDKEQIVVQAMWNVEDYINMEIKRTKIIYLRNVNQYNEIIGLEDEGIKVIDYMNDKVLGFVKNDYLKDFITQFKPSDIRLK